MDSVKAQVAAAAAGDADAFAILWRAHHPPLLRYLQTQCGVDRAGDIAAEAWMRALRDLDGFTGRTDGQFRAWLLTIGRHTLIDATRRRDWHLTPVEELPERPGPDVTSEHALEAFGTSWALSVIATLPPDQREVVALRVVADLDTKAVAAIVGRSQASVRVLLHRGLATLRARCEDPR